MKVEVLTRDGWQPAEQPELLHQVPTTDDVIRALSTIRTAVVEDEYKLHETVSKHLSAAGIPFEREYRLGPRNRIDFYIPGGTGIEVKKGKPARAQVIAQLERYTRFDKIKAVIFVIERSMDIPEELNGKTCICFPLNKLWGVALP